MYKNNFTNSTENFRIHPVLICSVRLCKLPSTVLSLLSVQFDLCLKLTIIKYQSLCLY